MTATLQKSIMVCTVIALTVTVAGADSFIPVDGVSQSGPFISSKIHVGKSNILPNVVFAQDIFNSSIKVFLTSGMTLPVNDMTGPASFNSEANSLANAHVKSLPAAPGAIFMGMIGFLIVTLVRDRKFWMSVFAGLIVIGQIGILSVPRFAARLTQNKQQVASLKTGNFLSLKLDNVVEEKNAEITHYIGLLRRLAGSPEDANHSLRKDQRLYAASPILRLASLEWSNSLSCWNSKLTSANVDRKNNFPNLSFPFCLIRHNSPSHYYSAAFAYQSLPRGPPFAEGIDIYSV